MYCNVFNGFFLVFCFHTRNLSASFFFHALEILSKNLCANNITPKFHCLKYDKILLLRKTENK